MAERLHPDDLEAIARSVADQLGERLPVLIAELVHGAPWRLVDTATAARMLAVSECVEAEVACGDIPPARAGEKVQNHP